MTYIDWQDDLNTGIGIIDEQHKRIVQYINELHAARLQEDGHLVGDVLGELVDYTISHFAFEESLMEKAGYPFLDPHKKVHSLFVERVGAFVERHKAGEDVGEELLYMLHKWLFNHIRNEDGDYAKLVMKSIGNMHNQGGWLSRAMHRFFG